MSAAARSRRRPFFGTGEPVLVTSSWSRLSDGDPRGHNDGANTEPGGERSGGPGHLTELLLRRLNPRSPAPAASRAKPAIANCVPVGPPGPHNPWPVTMCTGGTFGLVVVVVAGTVLVVVAGTVVVVEAPWSSSWAGRWWSW